MSDKAALVVHFPVDRHVYKYLQKKVGEKLVVSKNNFFGSMVLDILQKNYSDLERVPSEMVFPVEVSIRYMEKMGFYLDSRSIRKFNTRIDDVFREEMVGAISLNFEKFRIPKERSLRELLDFYNITEEDIKFETLVRDFKRKIKAVG
jgi:hypothetical protein